MAFPDSRVRRLRRTNVRIELSPEDMRPVIVQVVTEALRQFGTKSTAPSPPLPLGLMDVRAAAKRLGIGITKLRQIPANDLPVVRIGRRCLYRAEDLDGYAARSRI